MGATHSRQAARLVQREVEAILREGAFQVNEWHSNEKEVDTSSTEETTVLGLIWRKTEDTLRVKTPTEFEGALTHRKLMGFLARIWDPLGQLSPVLVPLKVRLQQLWDLQLGWDEPLPKEEQSGWAELFKEVVMASQVTVPRQVIGSQEEGELHMFSDASAKACGAAIWMVGPSRCKFVAARTMVAPRKTQSIPRLELMGLLMAVRLLAAVQKPLKQPPVVFWTDSQVVLNWVRTQSTQFKQYVSARVQEIHDLQPDIGRRIRYVPTNLNPADALTKDKVRSEGLRSWLLGPAFILEPRESWPRDLCLNQGDLDGLEEFRREEKPKVRSVRRAVKEGPARLDVEVLLRDTKGWSDLVRAVAAQLEVPDEGQDQTAWERKARAELFREAQRCLRDPPEGTSWLIDEDGLVRLQGRLNETALPERVRHPIDLDGSSEVARRIAAAAHLQAGHPGQRMLKHWLHTEWGIIIRGLGRLSREVKRNCDVCQREEGGPYTL